jgi:Phosphate-starvation-inducible E family
VGGPESRTLDDEGLPRPPAVRGKIPRSVLRILVHAESVMFMAIAVALVVIAVVVFARGGHDLELVRTIVARLEGGGFQLQPFLVIGIISATRDILTVGAELSLVGEQTPLVRTMTELGVNAGVVVALPVALVLVRRFARLDRA